MKSLTAVLFAGGESRRMGADKAVLQIGNEPLWSRQLRILRELQPERILISARCRPAWSPPEMETVPDQPPSRGPLNGLAAALAVLETSHAMVLALDMPLVESHFLRQLWNSCDATRGVVPQRGNTYEPLCAIYPAAAENLIRKALAGANHSLQPVTGLLVSAAFLKIVPVEPGDRHYFFNLNTPADYSAIQFRRELNGRPANRGDARFKLASRG
jgi:molybdopterin-guanine dinucleotide biosynthesis protein A